VGCGYLILLNNSGLYGMLILGPGVRVAPDSASHFDAFRGTPKSGCPLHLFPASGRDKMLHNV